MHKRCIIKKVATEKTVGEAGQRCIYRRHARKGGFVSRSLGPINSNEGGARWTTVTSRSWMTPALGFSGAARKRIARMRCGRVGEGPEDVEPYPLL